ncbi:hypothetical protein [Streptomyces sp. NPDC005141]
MTQPAVSSGAVPRLVRGTAGRRALRVVLLAGGFCALGFLFGGTAQAADRATHPSPVRGVEAARTSVDRLLKPASHAVPAAQGVPVRHVVPLAPVAPATQAVQGTPVPHHVPLAHVVPVPHRIPLAHVVPGTRGALSARVPRVTVGVTDGVGRVLGDVVRPVAGAVVRPVGDLVESVSSGLPMSPGALPSVSALPVPPGRPDPAGQSAFPGAGARPPFVTGARQPVRGVAEQPSATEGGGGTGRRSGATASTAPAYGPGGFGAGGAVVVERGVQDVVQVGQAHARRSPPGDPSGALGRRSAVDSAAPRHGDAPAVAPNHRAPLWLAPGASAVVTPAGTRDRHRAVPVLPG